MGGVTLSAKVAVDVAFEVMTPAPGVIDSPVNTYGLDECASADERCWVISVEVSPPYETVERR